MFCHNGKKPNQAKPQLALTDQPHRERLKESPWIRTASRSSNPLRRTWNEAGLVFTRAHHEVLVSLLLNAGLTTGPSLQTARPPASGCLKAAGLAGTWS